MKNVKKILYILIPIAIAFAFTIGFNKFLDLANNSLLKSKDLYPMLHDPVSLIKDKGQYANNKLVNDEDYILMMGSSEFSHSTTQHPDYYFDTERTKHGAITVGRAYTQSLQHSTVLGSLDKGNKDKKVILILSMQWFMAKNGVTENHFETRFSPVQFYKYLDNPKISKENKIEYAKRIKELLVKSKDFKAEHLYATLYLDRTDKGQMVKTAFEPYFMLREYMVTLKDKGILFEHLMALPDKKSQKDVKPIDWKKERELAIKEAQERVGNKVETFGGKRIYIDKGYYNNKIKPREKSLKMSARGVKLKTSKEYEDLELFLKTCKDMDVEPTLVLVPVSDEYYVHLGISRQVRQAYYDKIKGIAGKYNCKIVDISNEDRTRYYLRDPIHIGTLGWVDLCNKLYDIYER